MNNKISNILFIILLLLNIKVFGTKVNQQPDSLNYDDKSNYFSPFKEKLIIETNKSLNNDTITEKLIVQKQKERALKYKKIPKINRWDTLEFSDINIDSIKFIFDTGIYKQNYILNFLEQILVFKPYIKKDTLKKSNIKNYIPAKSKINKKTKTKFNNLNTFPKEWSFVIIIIVLILVLIIRFIKQKTLKLLFSLLINYQLALKKFKENNSLSLKIDLLVTSIFVINISFFLTLACYRFNYFLFNTKGILLFLYILGIIIIFYTLKYIFYMFLAFVFNITNKVKEYYYNTFNFNKVLGIIFIPLNIILPFIKFENVLLLYKFIILLIIIFFIWKLLYSTFVAFRLKFSILYLILYLCALEILPALAVLKILL